MPKVRTREENAAYARAQRAKKRLAAVSPVSPHISSTVLPCVSPEAPCIICHNKDIEIAHLHARIAALEAQGKKGTHSAPVSDDEVSTLHKRAIADMGNRVNNYGRNQSIGRASL